MVENTLHNHTDKRTIFMTGQKSVAILIPEILQGEVSFVQMIIVS